MGLVATLHLPPHGPVQEYWLVGLVRFQVAAERLSTWLFATGLALKLGSGWASVSLLWRSARIVHSDCLASYVECLQD